MLSGFSSVNIYFCFFEFFQTGGTRHDLKSKELLAPSGMSGLRKLHEGFRPTSLFFQKCHFFYGDYTSLCPTAICTRGESIDSEQMHALGRWLIAIIWSRGRAHANAPSITGGQQPAGGRKSGPASSKPPAEYRPVHR